MKSIITKIAEIVLPNTTAAWTSPKETLQAAYDAANEEYLSVAAIVKGLKTQAAELKEKVKQDNASLRELIAGNAPLDMVQDARIKAVRSIEAFDKVDIESRGRELH